MFAFLSRLDLEQAPNSFAPREKTGHRSSQLPSIPGHPIMNPLSLSIQCVCVYVSLIYAALLYLVPLWSLFSLLICGDISWARCGSPSRFPTGTEADESISGRCHRDAGANVLSVTDMGMDPAENGKQNTIPFSCVALTGGGRFLSNQPINRPKSDQSISDGGTADSRFCSNDGIPRSRKYVRSKSHCLFVKACGMTPRLTQFSFTNLLPSRCSRV